MGLSINGNGTIVNNNAQFVSMVANSLTKTASVDNAESQSHLIAPTNTNTKANGGYVPSQPRQNKQQSRSMDATNNPHSGHTNKVMQSIQKNYMPSKQPTNPSAATTNLGGNMKERSVSADKRQQQQGRSNNNAEEEADGDNDNAGFNDSIDDLGGDGVHDGAEGNQSDYDDSSVENSPKGKSNRDRGNLSGRVGEGKAVSGQQTSPSDNNNNLNFMIVGSGLAHNPNILNQQQSSKHGQHNTNTNNTNQAKKETKVVAVPIPIKTFNVDF